MSYTTFRIHSEAVYKKGIDIVVCDEAHQVREVQELALHTHILLVARPVLLDSLRAQDCISSMYVSRVTSPLGYILKSMLVAAVNPRNVGTFLRFFLADVCIVDACKLLRALAWHELAHYLTLGFCPGCCSRLCMSGCPV